MLLESEKKRERERERERERKRERERQAHVESSQGNGGDYRKNLRRCYPRLIHDGTKRGRHENGEYDSDH